MKLVDELHKVIFVNIILIYLYVDDILFIIKSNIIYYL